VTFAFSSVLHMGPFGREMAVALLAITATIVLVLAW
jgi:hypothetical protein